MATGPLADGTQRPATRGKGRPNRRARGRRRTRGSSAPGAGRTNGGAGSGCAVLGGSSPDYISIWANGRFTYTRPGRVREPARPPVGEPAVGPDSDVAVRGPGRDGCRRRQPARLGGTAERSSTQPC